MELFEPVERGFDEGGLMDEGGTVDPVSGNDVPPGSTQEEVRDDIPAQLSEGEFVFPADVVRYIGLENLMRMRQEAKQGLAQMDAMGQMGNSEEATVEDDLPFDMYDLDVEDDSLAMQQGGFVNPQTGTYNMSGTGITGFQQAPASTTGFTPNQSIQPYFKPTQFTQAQYQDPLQVTNIPTFGETVGTGLGQYDEMKTYVNDAGQVIQVPFKDGKPIYPILEGYRPQKDQLTVEKPTTTSTNVGSASVRDQEGSDNDNSMGDTGASIALGGKAVGPAIGGGIPGTRFAGPSRRVVGSTLYDVSFKNVGLNPTGFALNMIAKDGGLPPEGIGVVGVKGNRKAKIELPAVAYNSLRNDPRGKQAKAVQEALAARDALTSGNKASYVDGVLSVENKDGDMVAVSKDAIDLIGSTMYSEIKEEADGTFGFGKTDNLVDTAKDYYSGMNAGPDVVDDLDRTMSTEEKNARDALSAYNDQQFSDFVSQDEVYGGGSASDNNNDGGGMGNTGSDDTGGATGGGPSSGGTEDAGDMD